ncbi:CT027 protein, partial [Sakesphorus luctuosus]|nr:CT027 protein [Sakesphorus luctuosus]
SVPTGSRAKGGSVRFAPSPPPEGAHGHVHFQEQLHDSAVMVTQEKDGSFLVKVGFLKILHKYEITFLLPLGQREGGDVCALPVPKPNLRVINVTSLPEVLGVALGAGSARGGCTPSRAMSPCPGGTAMSHGHGHIKVTVQARVMDRHHGTPMLLDGVRCVGAELEYDSEQSDWHGFD